MQNLIATYPVHKPKAITFFDTEEDAKHFQLFCTAWGIPTQLVTPNLTTI